MKRIPIAERIALVVILAMIATNPLTGQYVMVGIELAFQQMFIYGAYVSLAGLAYLMGLMAYHYVKSTKVNIPAKTANTKAQAYLK
jgi:hypothetical protein